MTDLQPHEYANLFPLMTDRDYLELLESMKHNGYYSQYPIVLYEGKILDGRNRYRCAAELNILPMFTEFIGDQMAAYEYARSTNFAHKHWSDDQLSMIALEVKPFEEKLAKLRMSEAAKAQENRTNEYTQKVEGVVTMTTPSKKKKVTSRGTAAKKVGVSEAKVQRAQRLKNKNAKLAEQVKQGAMTLAQAENVVKKNERAEDIQKQKKELTLENPNIPQGVFDIIAIDPPWPYGTKYDANGRRAANPYPEMSLEQIAEIEIPSAESCILWLWTTHKFMRYSFALLDKWGFRDVAILTWVKDRMGLGTWLRSQSEFCIMAVKGHPLVELTNQTTIINGAMREHSRKPDEFYAMIDGLCIGRKLDYFSREQRDGWEQFGNDKSKF